ncbi:MAG: PAS domain S-box protein [Dehalococcoidia bacterium]|jgi:PAS domain-containing protein
MSARDKGESAKKSKKATVKKTTRKKAGAGSAAHQLVFVSADETRYSELFNHMSSGVAVYEAVDDGEDFIIKDFNPAAERIERISRDEVLGQRVTEVFPGVKDLGLLEVLQKVWRKGESQYLPDSIYRDSRDPGSWREHWVYRMQSGEIVSIYNDITERRLAEHALRQSEVRMNSILSAMTELVFVLDDEGRFVSYHGASQELYADPDAFMGKKYSDIMPPHFNELAADAIARNRAGETLRMEYSLQMPVGLQHYAATMSPIMIDGRYNGSVLVARNVTESRLSLEALSASEEKFRTLVENINDLMYTLDAEGHVTYASPAVERFTKYKVAELIGQPFMPLIHPDDLPGLLGSFDRLLSGQLEPWEFRVLDKDGRIIWVRSSSRPVYNEGKIVEINALMTDITEHKQTEFALRESDERLKLTLEAVNEGVFDWTIPENKAVYSPSNYTMLGYEPYEFPQDPQAWKDLVHPDDVDEGEREVRDHIEIGEGYSVEVRMRAKSGEWHWILIRGRVVEKDAGGKAIRIVGTHSDITSRKQAEQLLSRQREEYRTILDSVPLIITYIDRNGRIIRINKAGADALGMPPREVVGKTFKDFFPPDQAERFLTLSRQVMETKIHLVGRVGSTILPSQKVIWTHTDIVPYLDSNDNAIGSINVVMDITGRKLAEDALQESGERFRNMANLLPQTIFETDEKGNFTFVSSQGYQTFGYTEADVAAGMHVLQTIIPEDHARAVESIARRIGGEKFPPNEYTAITKDGRTFPVLVYADPILKAGVYAGMRGMLIDITERKQMEQNLKESIERLHKTLGDAVVTMGAIVEMKDPYTAGHQLQVARLAAAIAQEMGLQEEQVNIIRTAAAIHDIGKIYVPSDILAKPGKLGALEVSIIRTHAQGSYDILKNIDFGGPVAQIALQHHERLDGSGYPHGLKESGIMLEARILAVADVVEAISSHRPYRPSLGIENALAEIQQNRGKLYDPGAVDACLRIFNEHRFQFE